MLVTFLDDSIAFDGHSPAGRPLGGAEKSVIGLARSLARRGHTVHVYNRCNASVVVDGVSWHPLDECRSRTDWLIVHREPALLRKVAEAERRAVLLSAPAGHLAVDAVFGALNEFKPTLLLQGAAHTTTLPATLQSFTAATVHPGVGDAYLNAAPMAPVNPPRAVATTHPGRGLDWLLTLWCAAIHPRIPSAELHVYSAVLDEGALGATIPERLRPVLEQALASAAQGVRVKRPRADPEMAGAYRQARAHLYPGSERDVLCSTLAESQAVGLPAVARPLGAAEERLRNGETGYLAPDDDAFANLAACLLDDADIFSQLSEHARAGREGAGWERAAEEIERALEPA